MWRAWADRTAYQADCLLAVLLGGPEDTPTGLAAARARLAEQRAGRIGWGCVACRWIGLGVERHHCARQLEGRSAIRWAGLVAGLQITLLIGLVWWGLSSILERIW